MQGRPLPGLASGSSVFLQHLWNGVTDTVTRIVPVQPKTLAMRRRRRRVRPPRFFRESAMALKVIDGLVFPSIIARKALFEHKLARLF